MHPTVQQVYDVQNFYEYAWYLYISSTVYIHIMCIYMCVCWFFVYTYVCTGFIYKNKPSQELPAPKEMVAQAIQRIFAALSHLAW